MRRPLHFGHLLQVVEKEQQYLDIKSATRLCNSKGLNYGVSFYGVSRVNVQDIAKYKRIEVWCRTCPTPQQFKMLHDFFDRLVPKISNSIFSFDNGKLYKVNP